MQLKTEFSRVKEEREQTRKKTESQDQPILDVEMQDIVGASLEKVILTKFNEDWISLLN